MYPTVLGHEKTNVLGHMYELIQLTLRFDALRTRIKMIIPKKRINPFLPDFISGSFNHENTIGLGHMFENFN